MIKHHIPSKIGCESLTKSLDVKTYFYFYLFVLYLNHKSKNKSQ